VVSSVIATFAVVAPWDLPNSKYCGCSDWYWGGIPLCYIAASDADTERTQEWGHGRHEGCRYLCVTSWPHIPWGNRLYALHMHWMPHAEQDVFAKKGKIDRKHMAGAEL